MSIISSLVSTGLYLATRTLDTDALPPAKPGAVAHFIMADVSGSMYGQLPSLGKQLKNKIPTLVGEDDTVSLGWFSGRGQAGLVFENLRIRSVLDLGTINAAIDRYLRPVGLTGFVDPLVLLSASIDRSRDENPGAAISLTFMSDGYDNQNSASAIYAAAGVLADKVNSAAVVEYGYYANKAMLGRMAEILGAEYVFSEDYDSFSPVLDARLGMRPVGGKKVEVALGAAPRHGFVFGRLGDSVAVFATDERGTVRVPEGMAAIHWLSDAPAGAVATHDGALSGEAATPYYMALSVLSARMLADDTLAVLRATGDVRLIRQFAQCFGKQAYAAFQAEAATAVVRPEARLADGYDPSLVPAEDAFTVLDLLALLMADEGNLLHTGHEAFSYQRIGRKSLTVGDDMTDEEQAEIAAMAGAARSAVDLAAVQARIAEIVATKRPALKFEEDDAEAGVALSKLVLNETRPNVSVLVARNGTVHVGANDLGLPEAVPTHTFRNYTVIRDGILNVKTLPVSMTRATHDALAAEGVVSGEWREGEIVPVSLESLPIVNRRMVRHVSASECLRMQFSLTRAKAAQKVFKHYADLHFPKERAAGLAGLHGEAAAAWLESAGVTDGGFSPKVRQAEATDMYIGRGLKIALKGLSSLPKVDEVVAKMASGKALTGGAALMAAYVQEYNDFTTSPIYLKAADRDALMQTWLGDKARFWIARTREINRTLSEIKFSVIVGQVWFPEFDTAGEGTLAETVDGTLVTGTFTLEEKEFAV